MRAYVFTDRALERQAGRFVWLSVDTEKAQNAAFLEKYPIEAYPTLLVIDSGSEQAVLRWIGSATVPQLDKLLDDGERAMLSEGSDADALLATADRLLGADKKTDAAAAYKDAIAKAPAGWHGRDRAVESLLGLLSVPGSFKECVETARADLLTEERDEVAGG